MAFKGSGIQSWTFSAANLQGEQDESLKCFLGKSATGQDIIGMEEKRRVQNKLPHTLKDFERQSDTA